MWLIAEGLPYTADTGVSRGGPTLPPSSLTGRMLEVGKFEKKICGASDWELSEILTTPSRKNILRFWI